jgi:hypothetical protein
MRRLTSLLVLAAVACNNADASPDATSDAASDTTSDVTPDTTPDAPETALDVAPDTTNDAVPDVVTYPHTLTPSPLLTTPFDTLAPLRVQPTLAIGADQRLAMAWTGRDGDSLGIVLALARLDGATADTVTPFIANTTADGARNEPSLCALAGGGYALAWSVDLGNGADNLQVAWRRFAPDLTPLDPTDRIVVTDRPGNHWLAELACDPRGGFVLAGVRPGPPDSGFSAFFVRIASDGTQGPAVSALPDPPGDPTGSSAFLPQLAVDPTGQVVLAWEQVGACASPPCTDDTGLAFRRFPAAGSPSNLIYYRGATGRDASGSVVAVDPDGNALLGGILDNRLAFFLDSDALTPLTLPGSATVTTSSAAVSTGPGRFAVAYFAGTGSNVAVLYQRLDGTSFSPTPSTLATGSFPLAYRPALAARDDLRVVAWTESLGQGSFTVRLAAFTD